MVLAYLPATKTSDTSHVTDTYYTKWVDTFPTICRLHTILDAKHAQWLEPNIWDLAQPNHPRNKTRCAILAIANQEGFQTYPQWTTIHNCFEATPPPSQTIPSQPVAGPTTQDTPNVLYKVHKKLRELPSDNAPHNPPPQSAATNDEVGTHYKHRYPLRWDWTTFAYTDGSIIPDTKNGPGIGAAVYLPPGASPQIPEETTIPINPGNTAEGTINRAELAAIWVALHKGATHIATDSQCCIHQIQKTLNRPHNMKEHRHRTLLQHIVGLIKDSPTTITLYKVKAHTGIDGNEKADQMAKKVAHGNIKDAIITDVPESNRRDEQHWASFTPPPTAQEPNPKTRQLHTMDSHLREVIHPQHKLGMADPTTCYYASWQATAPHMMPTETNAFMAAKQVTGKEKRNAIQYRCGQLYNNKLAMRWKHTTTDKCPLCGEPDGGHHIASGCKKLKDMYIDRHHRTGRTILKAILKGERAAEIAYADVGSKEHQERENIPAIDKRHKLRLPSKSTRPDIILTSNTPHDKDRIHQITLVELKYCRDSDINPQLDKAMSQHATLKHKLKKQYNCEVHITPILIGVSGAIYHTHTSGALQNLGIRGNLLKTTLRKLHCQAIQSLGTIVSTRRKCERRQQSVRGRRGRQDRGRGPPLRTATARFRDAG
jgi:ribonuclease HI